jgi:hypothetical protein
MKNEQSCQLTHRRQPAHSRPLPRRPSHAIKELLSRRCCFWVKVCYIRINQSIHISETGGSRRRRNERSYHTGSGPEPEEVPVIVAAVVSVAAVLVEEVGRARARGAEGWT